MTLQELSAKVKAAKDHLDACQKAVDEAGENATSEQWDAISEATEDLTEWTKRHEIKKAAESSINNATSGSGRQSEATNPAANQQRISDVHDRRDDDMMAGFKTGEDYYMTVLHGSTGDGAARERLENMHIPNQGIEAATSTYHSSSGSDNGGWAVPPAISNKVAEYALGEDSLVSMCDTEPTNSNVVQKDRDEETPWSSNGIQVTWGKYGTAVTASNDTGRDTDNVDLHEVRCLVNATKQLLRDGPRFFNKLTRTSGIRINWTINSAIWNGTGVGQPEGWFAHNSVVTVAKESGQSADTIVLENLANMYARLYDVPGGNPVWFANKDTLKELLTMTSGNNNVVLLPNQGATGKLGKLFIFGIPVMFTEQAQTLGDLGDINLVDLKGYYVPMNGAMELARSLHLYFDQSLESFRWTFDMGGQPHFSAPITPPNSSATRSCFVKLAART